MITATAIEPAEAVAVLARYNGLVHALANGPLFQASTALTPRLRFVLAHTRPVHGCSMRRLWLRIAAGWADLRGKATAAFRAALETLSDCGGNRAARAAPPALTFRLFVAGRRAPPTIVTPDISRRGPPARAFTRSLADLARAAAARPLRPPA